MKRIAVDVLWLVALLGALLACGGPDELPIEVPDGGAVRVAPTCEEQRLPVDGGYVVIGRTCPGRTER